MKKSENTLLQLEAALQRVINGETLRIRDNRKLSVRAVEEEAGLGNGSCYYYKDFKEKIQAEKIKISTVLKGVPPQLSCNTIREKYKHEKKVKIQYREQIKNLKHQLAIMAAEHHQLSHALRLAYLQIETLQNNLVTLQRNKVTRIK